MSQSTASEWVDRAEAVRAGEDLDPGAVHAFLQRHDPALKGPPAIRQFPRGASNLTYLLDYGDRSFVLRRPPFGDLAPGAHDMLREARVMQALRPHFPHVPKVVAATEDPTVLGVPFFVMERIEGVILRRELPPGLALSPAQTRRLCESVFDRLVELHSIDVEAAGLTGLGRGGAGDGPGYAQRQIEGWTRRYRRARTPDVADFEEVMGWLAAHRPAEEPVAVIHNDYRLDNVVLDGRDPMRVIGVLDWELSTLGDPLMDLASALAYWVEAGDEEAMQRMRLQPSHAPGMPTRRELVTRYLGAAPGGASAPADLERFAWYVVYGLFRLAGILQQIYARYAAGATRDPRFASFGAFATTLEARCRRIIDDPGAW